MKTNRKLFAEARAVKGLLSRLDSDGYVCKGIQTNKRLTNEMDSDKRIYDAVQNHSIFRAVKLCSKAKSFFTRALERYKEWSGHPRSEVGLYFGLFNPSDGEVVTLGGRPNEDILDSVPQYGFFRGPAEFGHPSYHRELKGPEEYGFFIPDGANANVDYDTDPCGMKSGIATPVKACNVNHATAYFLRRGIGVNKISKIIEEKILKPLKNRASLIGDKEPVLVA